MPNFAHLSDGEIALQDAADNLPYFVPTCDGKVTYLAGPGADRYEVRVDGWQARFGVTKIDVFRVGSEVSLGERKSAKAALRLLVKIADAVYSDQLKK